MLSVISVPLGVLCGYSAGNRNGSRKANGLQLSPISLLLSAADSAFVLPAPVSRATGLIALGSYAFYGWANPAWAVLMFLSSGVDYVCGLVLFRQSGLVADGPILPIISKDLPRNRAQKTVLLVSICSNLGLLAFFKYYGFATENLNAISRFFGGTTDLVPTLRILLPVGISFYTFKSMSYAIDVYRGDARPMRSFTDFCCFEAFFPDLVAGPIVRYGAIEQQMRSRTHTPEKFAPGRCFPGAGDGEENPDRQSDGARRRRNLRRWRIACG